METTIRESSLSADTPLLPNKPLQIRVTQPARENIVLRALIRRAIPLLERPEAYSREARCGLAQTLARAVKTGSQMRNGHEHGCMGDVSDGDEPPHTDSDAPPEEDDYEPGYCHDMFQR